MCAAAAKRQQPHRRLATTWLVLIPTLVGLIVGIIGGLGVVTARAPQYAAISTFALLPQSKTSSTVDTGQLALLTPVYAAVVNDSTTKSLVAKQLGRPPAPVTSLTYPASDLVFTVTASAPTAQLAYATARAYEHAIVERSKRGDLVSAKAVRVQVVTSAALPTRTAGLSLTVILGAAAVGGLLVGLGVGLLLLRRRTEIESRGSAAPADRPGEPAPDVRPT